MVDLTTFINEGDTVLIGQGSAEPRALVEALVAQRHRLSGVTVLMGASFTGLLTPDHSDSIRFVGLGGVGQAVHLARAGCLEILPVHLGSLGHLITSRALRVDVVMAQMSRPDAAGQHSLGLVADYLPAAIAVARSTLAEINSNVPFTNGHPLVGTAQLAATVHDDRPLIEVPQREASSTDAAIATFVADLVPDGATLQVGIGATPDGVLQRLADRRGLGVHTGVMTDAVLNLIERGAVDNSRKETDTGFTVTGSVFGTARLYRWADRQQTLRVCPVTHVFDPRTLASFNHLFALNGALEVDLSGQINAETMGGVHAGTIGGGPVFARAAMASHSGRSIITLASTTSSGLSRIVPRIADSTVTTTRSDADVIVTEFGVADLRGATLAQRAKRLIAIAHPSHREELDRHSAQLAGTRP